MQTQSFPPPVLILAAPGLPAQTLAAALGQGPAAYDLPELNLEQMATIDVLRREMTGIRAPQVHGLMRAVAQLYAGEQTAAAIEMAGRWMTRRGYLSTAAVAQELAARIAPRRMVLPVHASVFDRASLRRLRATFPEASYVHLHAHPRPYGRLLLSSTSGLVALQLSGALDETQDPPLPDPQALWLMAETALAEFLSDLPDGQQIEQVRMADLTARPAAAVADIARRLGLPSTGAARRAMQHPERSPFAGPGPMGAHMGGVILSLRQIGAEAPAEDAEPCRLDGPLPWRPDGAGFRAEVRALAETMGYA